MTIARQDNRDGVTMGRVVGAFEGTLRIGVPASAHRAAKALPQDKRDADAAERGPCEGMDATPAGNRRSGVGRTGAV